LTVEESETVTVHSTIYVDSWQNLQRAAEIYPEAKSLRDRLQSWAQYHNLAADWLLDAVLLNLLRWHRDDEARRALEWGYPGSFGSAKGQVSINSFMKDSRPASMLIPSPVIAAYNPMSQSRASHERVVLDALHHYYERQEALFRRIGYEPPTRKRKRNAGRWDQMNWFVQYQLLGRTCAEIADAPEARATSEDAVLKAVRSLSRLLELPLRPKARTVQRRKRT
jgi:hypothetical protein